MKTPLMFALALALGATTLDVAAQDAWRGEQRATRGSERGQPARAEAPSRPQIGARAANDDKRGGPSHSNGPRHNPPPPVRTADNRPPPGHGGPRPVGGGHNNAPPPPPRYAQHRDERGRHAPPPSNRRDWDRGRYDSGRRPQNDWRHHDWRRSWHHGWSGNRYRAPVRYVYPQGYRYNRWSIGYRLPPPFLVASYYVDYRPYGLAPPPYGCRWLRVDRDLLLVELVSGEIVDILYNFYY